MSSRTRTALAVLAAAALVALGGASAAAAAPDYVPFVTDFPQQQERYVPFVTDFPPTATPAPAPQGSGGIDWIAVPPAGVAALLAAGLAAAGALVLSRRRAAPRLGGC